MTSMTSLCQFISVAVEGCVDGYEAYRKYTNFVDPFKIGFLNIMVNSLLIFSFLLLIYGFYNSLQ